MKNKPNSIWENLPITRKLFLEIAVTAVVLFASNLFIYAQINQMVERMNSVYMSNVNLNELSDALTNVQNFMYKYLQVKDSESLTDYYRAEQDYRKLLDGLNVLVTDNPVQLLEKNIRNMSDSYLAVTDETVQAKRGQNVEKYKSSYESALKLYQFINHDIAVLNSRQFKNNSASYQTLQAALQYLEVISSVYTGHCYDYQPHCHDDDDQGHRYPSHQSGPYGKAGWTGEFPCKSTLYPFGG